VVRPEIGGWKGGLLKIFQDVGAEPDHCQTSEKTETSGKNATSGGVAWGANFGRGGRWNTRREVSRQ
jgi:hypothetical protein